MMLAFAMLAAAPLDAVQKRDLQCVGALAIVASEQQRGGGTRWPPLGDDGARYAQVIGERLVKTDRTREEVRALMVDAVAGYQKAKALPDADVQGCIARMREAAPPPAPPSLIQCAAMMRLAAEGAGPADERRKIETIASILDHKAREDLRAQGRSGAEADKEIGLAREAVAAEVKAREADGISAGLDTAPCFAMAAP